MSHLQGRNGKVGQGGRGEIAGSHFTLRRKSLYRAVPEQSGYGDKLCRVIDAADPGAVPGGSTRSRGKPRFLTGPNQDRRVFKDGIFARAEYPAKMFTTHKCQR